MKNLPRHQSNEKHKNKLNKVMLVATLGKFLCFSKISRALYLMKSCQSPSVSSTAYFWKKCRRLKVLGGRI